ncbi:hypothetical protein L484_005927 [Morus notabilis]|uniref:Piriformospora indica-insensitive protein 2 n=1 Tax=Morus notabilis TaxID=981085 RepID=W9R309_9ROSA|nr:protein TOO MANY MOUTHS [Morus notabilis]EXB53497.1 hypothetical protein L484_005927 [Morus notabilis]
MAPFHPLFLAIIILSNVVVSHQQDYAAVIPALNSAEQEATYRVLDSINSGIPWRSVFPGDLCSSAPHGVVCSYFSEVNSSDDETVHVTELSFGYVSDYTPNPPCAADAVLSPLLFTSFPFLRKLFFYNCFNHSPVSFPDIAVGPTDTLEELVFIDNPSFVGSLSGVLRNFTSLRRVVLTGNRVYGRIPDIVGDLVNLEELTLSRNQLSGEIPLSLARLKNLKVLDLSHNFLSGKVPPSMGINQSELLKLDLSSNGLSGRIPESFGAFKKLQFLDLSFNSFGSFGVPMFLSDMTKLREVYLSGNYLGGQIPDVWENLGNVVRVGFSDMGLEGNIPASMGAYLKNLSYLGLDNNKLEGTVPKEFGLLKFVGEINLENNSLSGRVSFPGSNLTSRIGQTLKLEGNPGLCVDDEDVLWSAKNSSNGSFGQLKLCKKEGQKPNPVPLEGSLSTAQAFPNSGFVILGLLILLLFA